MQLVVLRDEHGMNNMLANVVTPIDKKIRFSLDPRGVFEATVKGTDGSKRRRANRSKQDIVGGNRIYVHVIAFTGTGSHTCSLGVHLTTFRPRRRPRFRVDGIQRVTIERCASPLEAFILEKLNFRGAALPTK